MAPIPSLVRFDLRVGVPQLGEIGRARFRVQFGQQAVVQRVGFRFGNDTVPIVNVAKKIASVGQAAWQAVTISPSRTCRFSFSASILAALMRCTQ